MNDGQAGLSDGDRRIAEIEGKLARNESVSADDARFLAQQLRGAQNKITELSQQRDPQGTIPPMTELPSGGNLNANSPENVVRSDMRPLGNKFPKHQG